MIFYFQKQTRKRKTKSPGAGGKVQNQKSTKNKPYNIPERANSRSSTATSSSQSSVSTPSVPTSTISYSGMVQGKELVLICNCPPRSTTLADTEWKKNRHVLVNQRGHDRVNISVNWLLPGCSTRTHFNLDKFYVNSVSVRVVFLA